MEKRRSNWTPTYDPTSKAKDKALRRLQNEENQLSSHKVASPSKFETEKEEKCAVRKMKGRKSLGGRKYNEKEEPRKAETYIHLTTASLMDE